MWVWAQNDPASTAIGSMTSSSQSRDHSASSSTSHQMTGRNGFHGVVSTSWP